MKQIIWCLVVSQMAHQCSGMNKNLTWCQVAQLPLRKSADSHQQSESPELSGSHVRASSSTTASTAAVIKKIPSGPLPTIHNTATSSEPSRDSQDEVHSLNVSSDLKDILLTAAMGGDCVTLRRELTHNASLVHLPIDKNRANLLHHAARHGRGQAVELLLAYGARVDACDMKGKTPLHYAVLRGNLEMVKKLHEKGARLLHQDSNGKTVLHRVGKHLEVAEYLIAHEPKLLSVLDHRKTNALRWAASEGHVEVVRLLLKHNINLDKPDDSGRTALWWAAGEGHLEVCKLLVNAGANIEVRDSKQQSIIAWTAHHNREAVARYLVDRKVSLKVRDSSRKTPLHWAVQHPALVKLFLEAGAEPDARDAKGATPLSWAAYYGVHESVKILLKHGADPALKDRDGKCPTSLSAEAGHTAIVQTLIATKKVGRDTLIHALGWAVSGGDIASIRAILSQCIEVDSMSNDHTPLIWATIHHHKDTVEFLLSRGAQVNKRDAKGQTALSWAVQEDQQDIAKLLLKAGARPDNKDKKGKTPLHWVKSRKIATLLINTGAVVNERDIEGKTALHWVCHEGILDLVIYLLERGADSNLCDHEGCSPMYWASGHPKVVKYLLTKTSPDLALHDEHGLDALHSAIAHGNLESVRTLVDSGMDPERPCHEHITPLMRAVQAHQEDIARYLLQEKKVAVNRTTPAGSSALTFAVVNHAMHMYELLVECGADEMIIDDSGRNLLHYGALVGNYPFVHYALEKGLYSIDACCHTKGRSALQWALRMCKGALKKEGELNPVSVTAAVILALVRHGADITLKDLSQNSALDHLKNQPWKCSQDELELLLKATTYTTSTEAEKSSFGLLFAIVYDYEKPRAEESGKERKFFDSNLLADLLKPYVKN